VQRKKQKLWEAPGARPRIGGTTKSIKNEPNINRKKQSQNKTNKSIKKRSKIDPKIKYVFGCLLDKFLIDFWIKSPSKIYQKCCTIVKNQGFADFTIDSFGDRFLMDF